MYDYFKDILTIYSEAKKIFPYWTETTLQAWEANLEEMWSLLSSNIDLRSFYLQMMKTTTRLNDGHTYIYPPKNLARRFHSPIQFSWIDDQLCVSKATSSYDHLLFQPILAINGLAPKEFLKQYVFPYFWHAKTDFALKEFTDYAFFILQENYQLTFSEKTVEIPFETALPQLNAPSLLPRNAQLLFNNETIAFYQIDKKAYVHLKNFGSQTVVESFYQQLDWLRKQETIIFDLRDNPGGNSGYADQISQAFFEKEFPIEQAYRQIIDMELYASGSQLAVQDFAENNEILTFRHQHLEKSQEYAHYPEYQGKLTSMPVKILQNGCTYSSGENFLITFEQSKRATLLGTTSAGSTGQPVWLPLKTGGIFQITAKKVNYPDGREHHNIGVNPEITIAPTIEDFQNKRDAVLERALN